MSIGRRVAPSGMPAHRTRPKVLLRIATPQAFPASGGARFDTASVRPVHTLSRWRDPSSGRCSPKSAATLIIVRQRQALRPGRVRARHSASPPSYQTRTRTTIRMMRMNGKRHMAAPCAVGICEFVVGDPRPYRLHLIDASTVPRWWRSATQYRRHRAAFSRRSEHEPALRWVGVS